MPRPSSAKARPSHIGICVRNLDHAAAFYRNALGFKDGLSLRITDAQQALLDVGNDVDLESRFLRQGNLVIELLHWLRPDSYGDGEVNPLNRVGLTHLSFNVDNLDQAIADVVAAGGTVLERTRSSFDLGGIHGEIVFVEGPDNIRIELMAFPDDIVNA